MTDNAAAPVLSEAERTTAARIGQVLFNRNYAELASERDIPGGELRTTAHGKQPYRVHIHAEPGTEAFEI
ncbi:MAG: hypothetical protein ACOVSI_08740, partial [Gemmatimonas sp.]